MSSFRVRLACAFVVCAASQFTFASDATAQTADERLSSALSAWIRLDAVPGNDVPAAATLARALPGWTADALGNLVKRVGSGSPKRVVACALDVPGFVVSEITADGYVRLHRAGYQPPHVLWDQFHEAQQMRILTRNGVVPGVVAIFNGHFTRQHRGDTTVVGVDQLWVDLGASTRADVEKLGVKLLDPVVADRPAWTYEGFAAGPSAGARASCAAVASAASGQVKSGETIFVLSQQRSFGWVGLAGILARLGAYDAVTLVDEGRREFSDAVAPRARMGTARARMVARVSKVDSVRTIAPRVRYAGTFVESISAADARTLLAAVARAANVDVAGDNWPAPPIDTIRTRVPRTDIYEPLEKQFATLAELPGVPTHEWRVRNAVRDALPAWAKSKAVVDDAGNLIVSAGPDRDSVAFIAHTDEVSFEVERILPDGSVALGRRGGVILTAWEGQPAMIHFDQDANGNVAPSLRGVFVPRDSARVKAPTNLTAWFGVDSAALVGKGVRIGSAITAYKRATRLAGTRFTARGSDDRTGSTALLAAIKRVNPATLTHKVIFVWSTGEETGLVGASAFGAKHGTSLARVYSVDTFVSSDTPLETPHFAFAQLGHGAVLRGLDDGTFAPVAERDRVLRAAQLNNIPLQVGTTHGSTDGSSISPYGVPNVGLSWPGRYSHTSGEILDFRDVEALARLITALAMSK